MKVTLENLGVIKHAEFELGDLTLICGRNNTGKTYATHAVYGFFEYLRSSMSFSIDKAVLAKLHDDGAVSLSLSSYTQAIRRIIDDAAIEYSQDLYRVFSGNQKDFKNARFAFELDVPEAIKPRRKDVRFGAGENSRLEMRLSEDGMNLNVLLSYRDEDEPDEPLLERMLNTGLREVLYSGLLPNPFMSSAERTGAAIFQKELDFTRNRLVDVLKEDKIRPMDLLGRFTGAYPLAVRRNVDFIRSLPNIVQNESPLMTKHPELLEAFSDIIGGDYKVTKDGEVWYIPKGKRVRLSLVTGSSSVRSLLDIGFYLRHVASPGDILMVDEPELNLHPENQRRVARLFARLINVGVKVFVTTHSDYIVKELNTLILLNQRGKRLEELAAREGYQEDELLDCSRVRVYTACEKSVKPMGAKRSCQGGTLVPAEITPREGIRAESFDASIEEMNRIQDEIVWGGDETDDV